MNNNFWDSEIVCSIKSINLTVPRDDDVCSVKICDSYYEPDKYDTPKLVVLMELVDYACEPIKCWFGWRSNKERIRLRMFANSFGLVTNEGNLVDPALMVGKTAQVVVETNEKGYLAVTRFLPKTRR